MRHLKWMLILAIILPLAACGDEEGAEETTETAEKKTEAAYEEAEEAAREVEEKATEAGDDDAWQATRDRAKEAWVATKEYSMEAWQQVRESFIGDMTAGEKQAFDDCVARLQKEEGLTEAQAERGCWRMMEEAGAGSGTDSGS